MSFFEQLSKLATTASEIGSFVEGIKTNTLGNSIAERVVNSIIKSPKTDKPKDPEDSPSTVTFNPSNENKVPVVYGKGFTKGIIVDAVLDNDDKSIWLSYVLSERTGTLIDGTQSVISFRRVLKDGYEILFDSSDGVTATAIRDSRGRTDTSINGLVKIYCYNNGTENQVFPLGYAGTKVNAYNIFPGWNSKHRYREFVLAVVKVTHSQEHGLTSIPDLTFELSNTMTEPGDVLYDYLTSTRYGAGVPESEINK